MKSASVAASIEHQLMKPIHPFPARMAPEILEKKLIELRNTSSVWDPMCGSGTSLRVAASLGITAVGTDTDPLAVKMARVGTRNFDSTVLTSEIDKIAEFVRMGRKRKVKDDCAETRKFKDYWFAEPQQEDLALVARQIAKIQNPMFKEFFEIALSRIIITKFRGASLAWDVPHSRPHRAKSQNDFDVRTEFISSCRRLASLCVDSASFAPVTVERSDARTFATPKKVDLVVTSPPYLNAIDYMRGHKLSLVWMGWTVPQLRELRSSAIGTERLLESFADQPMLMDAERLSVQSSGVPSRMSAIIRRYIRDCSDLMMNIRHNMTSSSQLLMVVADSNVRGITLKSAELFAALAKQNGFQKVAFEQRHLLPSKRYLPADTDHGIGNRMKVEHVLHFAI